MASPDHGPVFGSSRKRRMDVCPSDEGSYLQDASGGKPVTKDHTLVDSVYMECAEEAHL